MLETIHMQQHVEGFSYQACSRYITQHTRVYRNATLIMTQAVGIFVHENLKACLSEQGKLVLNHRTQGLSRY